MKTSRCCQIPSNYGNLPRHWSEEKNHVIWNPAYEPRGVLIMWGFKKRLNLSMNTGMPIKPPWFSTRRKDTVGTGHRLGWQQLIKRGTVSAAVRYWVRVPGTYLFQSNHQPAPALGPTASPPQETASPPGSRRKKKQFLQVWDDAGTVLSTLWVLNWLESPLSYFSTFVYRGSSNRRKSAACPKFDMVWLHPSHIPVGRRGVISSFKLFLPAFATHKRRGEGSALCVPTVSTWNAIIRRELSQNWATEIGISESIAKNKKSKF